MLSPDRPNTLHPSNFAAPLSNRGTACFAITASPEPGALPRLLGAFAQRSLVPERWHGVNTSDGELQVDIQVDGLTPEVAERVAAKLRALIDVRTVLLYQKA